MQLELPLLFYRRKGAERKKRLYTELSADETLQIIGDFAEAGALTVNIVGAGEPLIDPLLPMVLHQIAELGMVPVVFTHGAELATRPKLIGLLQEVQATVVVKLNSSDAVLQDAIVGRKGYTNLRDMAVTTLLEQGFANTVPTRLAIDTLAFKGNLKELPRIHRWARMNNVFPISAGFIPTGRTGGGQVSGAASLRVVPDPERKTAEAALAPIDSEDTGWLRDCIQKIDAEYGVQHHPCSAYFGGGQCTQILGLYVDVLGRIWPCVARQQIGPNPSLEPLAYFRDGILPSEVWASHPYMRWIRENYNGGCPYKH